jgi:hypothetical protein
LARFSEREAKYLYLLQQQPRCLWLAKEVIRAHVRITESWRELRAVRQPIPKTPSRPLWAMQFKGLAVDDPCWEGR